MSKKIILAVLTLVVTAVLFCGCSQVNFGRIVYSSGAIGDIITVSIDQKIVENADLDFEKVIECVEDEMKSQLNASRFKVANVDTKVLVNYGEGTVTGQILYKTYDAFAQVYNITDDDEDDEKEIEKGIFYDKEIVSKGSILYTSQSAKTVTENIEYRLRSTFNIQDLPFSIKDVDCYYTYSVPYAYASVNRLRTNCSYYYDNEIIDPATNTTDTLRFYVWQYDQSHPDQQVLIWKNHIHAWPWYVLALILTAVFIAILCLINYLKKKKQNSIPTQIIVENVEK